MKRYECTGVDRGHLEEPEGNWVKYEAAMAIWRALQVRCHLQSFCDERGHIDVHPYWNDERCEFYEQCKGIDDDHS